MILFSTFSDGFRNLLCTKNLQSMKYCTILEEFMAWRSQIFVTKLTFWHHSLISQTVIDSSVNSGTELFFSWFLVLCLMSSFYYLLYVIVFFKLIVKFFLLKGQVPLNKMQEVPWCLVQFLSKNENCQLLSLSKLK